MKIIREKLQNFLETQYIGLVYRHEYSLGYGYDL